MKKRIGRQLLMIISLFCIFGLLSGCAHQQRDDVFVYGDTTFNMENDEADVNPHRGYSGWACIRYGIGETLFRYSDDMNLEPWLATAYEHIDDLTWKITLRHDVHFTSGRKMDAQSVKECLDHLVSVHMKAAQDLKIAGITVDDQYTLTIKTQEPVPALMNYLSDPYGCIIDMKAGITEDGNVSATGPYQATNIQTDKGLTLVKNENYYNGTPQLEQIEIKTISDGDTLTMALQSGELDAAYGLPYASLPLFTEDKGYQISSCETSRTFFMQLNLQNEILQDQLVREALSYCIDRDNFTSVLLDGHGTVAKGPFPMSFYNEGTQLTTLEFNLSKAKALLQQAGWQDNDGDGYLERNGQKLHFRYLTYPSRQELPLLAQSIQATFKEVGIELEINNTASFQDYLNQGQWDIYASAFVSAPTGDPEYFFATHCLANSSKNWGHYTAPSLEKLAGEMASTFDAKQRKQLAAQMTQILLDDHAFIFVSHLEMSLVYNEQISGLKAHPCDYYEITVQLQKK